MAACIKLCKKHRRILGLPATVNLMRLRTKARCEAQCPWFSLCCRSKQHRPSKPLSDRASETSGRTRMCDTSLLSLCPPIPLFPQCDCGSAKMISLNPPEVLQSIASCANPTSTPSRRQYGYRHGTSAGRMGTSGASLYQAELES